MRRMILLATLAAAGIAPAGAAAVVGFHSPSDNIGCSILKSGVRCDILHREWQSPPQPGSCHFDWGSSVGINRHGKAHFLCVSDSALGLGKELAYGDSITSHRFRCKSLVSGIRCTNKRNGRGFALSRQRYRFF